MTDAMKRPNPLLWVYYAFGGRLPDRYREWVLADATSRIWLLRAVLRGFTQITPFAAVFVVLIVVFAHNWWMAIGVVILGILGMLPYSLAYAGQSVNSRLVAYGYPPNYATNLRKERYKAEHADEEARYRATWRTNSD